MMSQNIDFGALLLFVQCQIEQFCNAITVKYKICIIDFH